MEHFNILLITENPSLIIIPLKTQLKISGAVVNGSPGWVEACYLQLFSLLDKSVTSYF